MTAPPRICLIYARVSSKHQAEKWSLPAQRRILEVFAARQGWQFETHSETGSGETIEARPVFRSILTRIAAGAAHTLLVIEAERLTRAKDLRELAVIQEACRAGDCRVATPQQSLDLGDAEDSFLHSLFGILSAREKQKLLARQKRGMAEAKAAGKWHGGGVPTGYRYDRDAKTIVPDPAHVDEVREFLADALVHGVRALRGRYPAWSYSSVQRAVTRRRIWWYAARVPMDDGTTVPACWAPIISEDQALALIAAKDRRRHIRDRSKTACHLLTGLGIWRCGHCGSGMRSHVRAYARNSPAGAPRRRCYRCRPWWADIQPHSCKNSRLIPCPVIDGTVLRAIWGALPSLLAAAQAPSGGQPAPSALAARLAAATARRDRLVAAIEDGTLTASEARDRLTAARREIAGLAGELEVERAPTPAEIPAELLRHMGRPPEVMPLAEARELVRATCRRVEIYDGERLVITLTTGAVLTVNLPG